ncbi:SRPBCC family protein [Conexibacter sp. W3-3-2]|nr:SRPBCC family protein [Conexibacter sp. W3-3-2]
MSLSLVRGVSRAVLRYQADTAADAATAWALLARPDRWSDWAPHVRGAWGLGEPEVREGARGAARLLGVVPVPARITAVEAGRSWTWDVGGILMDHVVEPLERGAVVAVQLRAPAPVEALLARTYGPVVALLVRRLARVAERPSAGR